MAKVRASNPGKDREAKAILRSTPRPEMAWKDMKNFKEELAKQKFNKACKSCGSLLLPDKRKNFMGWVYCSICYKSAVKGGRDPKWLDRTLWKIRVDIFVESPGPCSDRHSEEYLCYHCRWNPVVQKKLDVAVVDLARLAIRPSPHIFHIVLFAVVFPTVVPQRLVSSK